LTYLLLKVNVGIYPWTNIAATSEVLSPDAE
jgi:hypothetical protein